jgi:hypothetical protein
MTRRGEAVARAETPIFSGAGAALLRHAPAATAELVASSPNALRARPATRWADTVLLLLVIISAFGRAAQAKIELSSEEADFGTIANTVPVTRTLDLRNEGAGTLEITALSTSCSCTVAEVAAHQIAPGGSTLLTITFGPSAHNGATGRFMRQVTIESNDPGTPQATFTFWVEVVDPDS